MHQISIKIHKAIEVEAELFAFADTKHWHLQISNAAGDLSHATDAHFVLLFASDMFVVFTLPFKKEKWMQQLTWVGTRTGGYASLWCLYIQNEKSTITAIPIIGTNE